MTITRFKKGSKVEVLNRKEAPSGMWCPAVIVSGNGHTYLVKYYRYPANIVERVPRKGIRPSPPSMVGPWPWFPGDVVEVLDDYSWKIAQLSRVVGGGYYDVRLLGSLTEFRAHSSDVRVQQSWINNKWVVISKDSRELMGGTLNKVCQNISYFKEDEYAGNGFVMSEYDNVPSMLLTKGTRKRPSTFLPPPLETCMGASRKTRATEVGGRYHRPDAESSTLFHEKVDAVASPQNMLGEKYMHASLNKRTTHFSEIQRLDGTADDNCCNSASLEPIDTETVSSSVGSCSLRDSPSRLSHFLVNGLTEDVGSSSHDCEIPSHSRSDLSLPTKEAVKEEMHCLELHAYKKSMQAFYASGPISWEQEALMTNMRITLHISNDEHLTELRKFISAERNFR